MIYIYIYIIYHIILYVYCTDDRTPSGHRIVLRLQCVSYIYIYMCVCVILLLRGYIAIPVVSGCPRGVCVCAYYGYIILYIHTATGVLHCRRMYIYARYPATEQMRRRVGVRFWLARGRVIARVAKKFDF